MILDQCLQLYSTIRRNKHHHLSLHLHTGYCLDNHVNTHHQGLHLTHPHLPLPTPHHSDFGSKHHHPQPHHHPQNYCFLEIAAPIQFYQHHQLQLHVHHLRHHQMPHL